MAMQDEGSQTIDGGKKKGGNELFGILIVFNLEV